MTKSVLNYCLLFLSMILIQIICNRICLFNIAVPLVFIYFILRLPISISSNWVISLAFLLGLSVDIFSNTLGINALSCTLLGAIRKPVFSLFFPREDELPNPVPGLKSLGLSNYLKYMLTLSFIFCFLVFLIQSFSFYDFQQTILRIVGSSILSSIIIFGFESLATTHREKRL